MGVKVTRKYTNGRTETTSYVCFGFLANDDGNNSNVVEMDYHVNHDFNRTVWGSIEAYMKAMAEIVSGNPMFKHCKVHPRKGVITVKNVDTIPCDQLMACLFTARNMAQVSHSIQTYKYLRELGFSPIVSYTVSQIFVRKHRIGPLDNAEQRWSRWGQNESSIFHQATFGELAFKRMIRQGYSKKVFNPWKQETFTSQGRYLRDSTIQSEWGYVQHVLDSHGDRRREGVTTQHANYMSFCFSDFSGKETNLVAGENKGARYSDERMITWINSMLPKRLRVEVPENVNETPVHLRVGSSVRMSQTGATRYSPGGNPNNTTIIGQITNYTSDSRIRVSWSNGMSNSYRVEDLVAA